jgi:hypothetical protein
VHRPPPCPGRRRGEVTPCVVASPGLSVRQRRQRTAGPSPCTPGRPSPCGKCFRSPEPRAGKQERRTACRPALILLHDGPPGLWNRELLHEVVQLLDERLGAGPLRRCLPTCGDAEGQAFLARLRALLPSGGDGVEHPRDVSMSVIAAGYVVTGLASDDNSLGRLDSPELRAGIRRMIQKWATTNGTSTSGARNCWRWMPVCPTLAVPFSEQRASPPRSRPSFVRFCWSPQTSTAE